MLLHHLREHDEFVVDALPLLSFFHAVGREIEKILALNLIDVDLATERS